MTDVWQVDPRPVPVELTDEYTHETYPPKPVFFPPVMDRLKTLDKTTLLLYASGVTAPGAWRHTEIGDE